MNLTDAALPPGHVPTLRIATPDPRDAKRHILVPSGWTRYHVAACHIDLPADCSEIGSAPVDDIECPRCRETPEFARAVEQARNPGKDAPRRHAASEPAPRTELETPPEAPARRRPRPAPKKAENQPPANPQGSLF